MPGVGLYATRWEMKASPILTYLCLASAVFAPACGACSFPTETIYVETASQEEVLGDGVEVDDENCVDQCEAFSSLGAVSSCTVEGSYFGESIVLNCVGHGACR